jgi:hypothetical protein
MMAPDLQARHPGGIVPDAVRDAATRAGRCRKPVDPPLLRRVRDALVRLPDSALSRHYFAIPGDCLASPRTGLTPWADSPGRRQDGT